MLPWRTIQLPRGLLEAPRAAALVLGIVAGINPAASAEQPRTYQLDPFAQATGGYRGCPAAKPPVLTEQEMRVSAHERAERGTSCCLAGTCECGGAYKRDPEINGRVAIAIKADVRFANTSVWVTTTRKFVTLQGCVRSAAQKKALERLVKHQSDVAIVWNETTVGVNAPKKKP
jgi:BON domain-containing protein